MKIPRISEKLKLLFLHSSTIRKQKQLADYLQVSPSTIVNWKNSGGIDDSYIGPICAMFNVTPRSLKLEDEAALTAELESNLTRQSFWDLLRARAVEGPNISIKSTEYRSAEFEHQSHNRKDTFRLGDEFEIVVDKPTRCRCVVLIQDQTQVRCLCPSAAVPDMGAERERLVIPDPKQGFILRFSGQSGPHVVYALLLKFGLTVHQTQQLQSLDTKEAIETLSRDVLFRDDRLWRVLAKPISVIRDSTKSREQS